MKDKKETTIPEIINTVHKYCSLNPDCGKCPLKSVFKNPLSCASFCVTLGRVGDAIAEQKRADEERDFCENLMRAILSRKNSFFLAEPNTVTISAKAYSRLAAYNKERIIHAEPFGPLLFGLRVLRDPALPDNEFSIGFEGKA